MKKSDVTMSFTQSLKIEGAMRDAYAEIRRCGGRLSVANRLGRTLVALDRRQREALRRVGNGKE